MSGVAQYLLRLICAAMVCALADAVGGRGPGQGMRRLVSGIFLVLTLFSLPGEGLLPELNGDDLRADAAAVIREGTDQAQEAKRKCISEGCAAYILSKADGLDLQVRVELGEDLMPAAVILSGQASPQERERLQRLVREDFGLGEEDVIWTEAYQSSE